MKLELPRKPDLVPGRQGKIGQDFLRLGPNDRTGHLFLVHIRLYRDHSLVVDAVYLAQATCDLECGNRTQGNEAFRGGYQ